MNKLLKYIEHALVWGIIIVISLVLVLSFIDVLYEIKESVSQKPFFVVNANQLMELFSMLLIILIGLELIETIKTYLKDYCVHVEHVVLVAIIAIARKVIVWDFEKYTHNDLFGISAITIALGITYFLVRNNKIKIKCSPFNKNSKTIDAQAGKQAF